ncbi:allophanate hydrolase 2 subunit 1 [Liquorilactobacillus sucicola DSM 21376 = JCM 15457]|uniref:Allophanate hydrolase 2 subunit 1 n=1 Tax=Liquorilactobacillus sucicola DSM 21376 = JCM 15457 TaxID=1423806 RepID=A0A023CV82_9LACO|nr:5-oxoprolinase subunit PxpB [Liquorilactobacillus sucicola]KRN05676.1 allophanate hydrolase 2 subunit 1 [Liquorilactobacillus sucicola DSM 21376 = JCM 15457]GAJ25762.1 allophanate hydrolase 2 subunit 1 [Liquorilactobacillus sucicola DSM 21376 = JCM 15457]
MVYEYRFVPVGEQALNVVFEATINAEENRLIHSLAHTLLKSIGKDGGITGIIPAYHTLTVNFDIFQTNYAELTKQITSIIEKHSFLENEGKKHVIEIPVCYDEEFGPDLDAVSKYGKTTFDELIRTHTEEPYLIYMMGFMPGFAYMGSVPSKIAMPRLRNPRAKVPAGSVAIAGKQTGMYPVEAPGGWRLIGRTPVKLYDYNHPEPRYFAGDYIRFKAISKKDFYYIQKLDLDGEYQLNELDQGEFF